MDGRLFWAEMYCINGERNEQTGMKRVNRKWNTMKFCKLFLAEMFKKWNELGEMGFRRNGN
jgi:hypothetical protein